MKKRLSLLMAALMIITMLPMSAFAAVHNTEYQTLNYTTANNNVPVQVTFKIKTENGVTHVGHQLVQITLDNAEFSTPVAVTAVLAGATNNAPIAPTVSGSTAVFTIPQDAIGAGGEATVKFTANVDFEDSSEGDVKLFVDTTGLADTPVATDAIIPDQDVRIGVVRAADLSDLAIAVKNPEKTVSFDGGELSQFTVSNFGKVDGADTVVISVDDDNIDLTADSVVIIDGVKHDYAGAPATGKYSISNGKIVLFAGDVDTTTKSIIVVPTLDKMGKRVSAGNVSVIVESFRNYGNTATQKLITSSKAVIGKVVDYNVTMTIVEKNRKEIPSVWGGEEATVRVTLKGPKGSLLDREIEFVAEGSNIIFGNGAAAPSVFTAVKGKNLKISGDPASTTSDDTVFKNREFSIKGDDFDTTEEVSFEIKIRTAGNKDGVATLTASQRGWEVTADLAKITPKFKATAEVNPLKKGEARDTSTITVTEAKAGLLEKGEKLVLTFDTRRDYTQITSKSVKVEATNGMTFDTRSSAITWIAGEREKYVGLAIPITKASSGEPAVITISGLNVSVDGSATEDTVALDLGLVARGKADADYVVVSSPDYIKVVKEYAMESILTVFTVGQTEYTVNGVAKSAASAPYIKNGRTMLPIRALAESLGLTVQWNGATKTATFSDDTKVAGVVIGADTMYVNGVPVKLAAKAELVNGTTFVELRSLATAFSVQIDWDAAAKTATVSK